MFIGDNLFAKVPLSCKKSISMGVVIPQKIRICNEGTEDVSSDGCDKLVSQNRKFLQI